MKRNKLKIKKCSKGKHIEKKRVQVQHKGALIFDRSKKSK